MKSQIKRILAIGLAVCFLMSVTAATVCAAPPTDQGKNKESEDKNYNVKEHKNLTPNKVKDEIEEKIKKDKKMQAANKYLEGKGLKRNNAVYGASDVIEVKDDKGQKKEMTQTIILEDYSSDGSTAKGAIVNVVISDGKDETTYTGVLEAPNGNIGQTVEHAVTDSGEVIETHSWFSCVRGQLGCCSYAPSCLAAAYGGYAAFLACVAPCGWCLTKAVACCTCNCSWWCGWAKCCHR